MLVLYKYFWAIATVFEQVSSKTMVKKAYFTAFYGILRHYLEKFPTEFFVFGMVAYVYMYITPLNRWLCCGIFSYLPQLKRGVVSTDRKLKESTILHIT